MFATMSQEAVDKYNKKMVVFSIIFLLSSWFFTHFGAVGFIFANCLNMLLRIVHRFVAANFADIYAVSTYSIIVPQ